MPHNQPIFPPGVIPPTFVVTPGHLELLDQLQSEALDGDAGNVSGYEPTSPIMIGGKGMDLRGAASVVSGVTSTGKDSQGLVLEASVYPTFSANRTRQIVVPLHSVADVDHSGASGFEPIFSPYYGLRGIKGSQWWWFLSLPQLRLHNGATLKRARLRFRSGIKPSALTKNGIPWFRIHRAKKEGTTFADFAANTIDLWQMPSWAATTAYAVDDIVRATNGGDWGGSNGYSYRCVTAGTSGGAQPAWSTTVGADQADGSVTWRVEYGWPLSYLHYQFPPIPASADTSLYHNDGLVQEIVHRVNMNATINTADYGYIVELVEPGVADNVYHSLVLEIEDLASLKEP